MIMHPRHSYLSNLTVNILKCLSNAKKDSQHRQDHSRTLVFYLGLLACQEMVAITDMCRTNPQILAKISVTEFQQANIWKTEATGS